MADTPIKNITSGYNVTKINDNFASVKTKIDGPLLSSSDGQNTMYQEFDMNGNNIINGNQVSCSTLTLNGQPVIPTSLGAYPPNSVGTGNLIDNAVTTTKINDGSITNSKVASGLDPTKVNFLQDGSGAVTRDISKKAKEIISPEDYGAVGDNVHDDTAAIQAAINYVLTLPRGGTVRFTQGRQYRITATLNVTKTSNKFVNLEGNGAFIYADAAMTGTMMYVGSTDNTIYTLPNLIKDLYFVGNGSITCMHLQWANGCILNGCKFQLSLNGVLIDTSYAVNITNCVWQDITQYGLITLTGSSNNLKVTQCQFNNVVGSGAAIYFQQVCYNIIIQNCDIETDATPLVLNGGGSSITVNGNYIEGSSHTPIFFGDKVYGFSFVGNWLGYNTGTQLWTRIIGGQIKDNIFWDQSMTVDPILCVDLDIGHNIFNGTSSIIYGTWQYPTLVNGYTNVGGLYAPVAFRKNASGLVQLRGSIQGTLDNVCLNLPAGYRPSSAQGFVAVGTAFGSTGKIQVGADGNVTAYRTSNGTVDLSGICFMAEA